MHHNCRNHWHQKREFVIRRTRFLVREHNLIRQLLLLLFPLVCHHRRRKYVLHLKTDFSELFILSGIELQSTQFLYSLSVFALVFLSPMKWWNTGFAARSGEQPTAASNINIINILFMRFFLRICLLVAYVRLFLLLFHSPRSRGCIRPFMCLALGFSHSFTNTLRFIFFVSISNTDNCCIYIRSSAPFVSAKIQFFHP